MYSITSDALAGASGANGDSAWRQCSLLSAALRAPQALVLRPYQSDAIARIDTDPHRRVLAVGLTEWGSPMRAPEDCRHRRCLSFSRRHPG